MIAYQAGSVLFCREIPDEQGRNHKDRFVLVVEDCPIGDTRWRPSRSLRRKRNAGILRAFNFNMAQRVERRPV